LTDCHANAAHGNARRGVGPNELRVVDIVHASTVAEAVHDDAATELEAGARASLHAALGLLGDLALQHRDGVLGPAQPHGEGIVGRLPGRGCRAEEHQSKR
jgi:short subunit dehydrogenase-like uncharacterized protein